MATVQGGHKSTGPLAQMTKKEDIYCSFYLLSDMGN